MQDHGQIAASQTVQVSSFFPNIFSKAVKYSVYLCVLCGRWNAVWCMKKDVGIYVLLFGWTWITGHAWWVMGHYLSGSVGHESLLMTHYLLCATCQCLWKSRPQVITFTPNVTFIQRWGLESETWTWVATGVESIFWDLWLACNDLRLDLKDLRLDLGLEAWWLAICTSAHFIHRSKTKSSVNSLISNSEHLPHSAKSYKFCPWQFKYHHGALA